MLKTHHCRFCNHLLLATTRSLPHLPRRNSSKDNALILPLPHTTTTTSSNNTAGAAGTSASKKSNHYTILLSTTLPDRKPSLVRREDGFEKRLFVRCGRCRVIVGYFLDPMHFVSATGGGGGDMDDGEGRVVYLLPGALVETESLGDEEMMQVVDREWRGWISTSTST